YSLDDAVAVGVGRLYEREGASRDRVRAVVRYLATLGVARLKEHLTAGRTFPVPGMLFGDASLPGMMIDASECFDDLDPPARALVRRLDLRHVGADVERRAAELTGAAPAGTGAGRRG